MKTIPLTQEHYAIVDDEDYDMLIAYGKWHWHLRGYAANGRGSAVMMHNLILRPPFGFTVDHIDGNGLNNQKSNLRVASCSQNQANQKKSRANTLGFKGITAIRTGGYIARIGKERKYLGFYTTKEEAAQAYDKAARLLYGSFARTNY